MYARTWASMMLYLPRSDEHASLPIERGKSPQTCHLLSSNKALFVWFWSPNLMDFLMARLPKNQPNQINHSRLNFFSAARCTPCFWCNMISRCGLCLWTRHPHVGIRWEVIWGSQGLFLRMTSLKRGWFCKVIWSCGNGTGMWSSWLWLGEYFKLKHLRVANGFWD